MSILFRGLTWLTDLHVVTLSKVLLKKHRTYLYIVGHRMNKTSYFHTTDRIIKQRSLLNKAKMKAIQNAWGILTSYWCVFNAYNKCRKTTHSTIRQEKNSSCNVCIGCLRSLQSWMFWHSTLSIRRFAYGKKLIMIAFHFWSWYQKVKTIKANISHFILSTAL